MSGSWRYDVQIDTFHPSWCLFSEKKGGTGKVHAQRRKQRQALSLASICCFVVVKSWHVAIAAEFAVRMLLWYQGREQLGCGGGSETSMGLVRSTRNFDHEDHNKNALLQRFYFRILIFNSLLWPPVTRPFVRNSVTFQNVLITR
jgi:hypothetical protein